MKPALYLIFILGVTVFCLIRAEMLENRRQIFFFKPLSTLLVILTALLSLGDTPNTAYTLGITLGLVLSLGGDIALIFEDNTKAFRTGLILFLLAHIVYAGMFTTVGQFSWLSAVAAATLLLAALGIYRLIRAGLGPMKIPVIAYMLIISLMMIQAAGVFKGQGIEVFHAALIFGGAVLFYVSDVILALNRFWRPWKLNRISLAFYYGGQMLIALSAGFFTA